MKICILQPDYRPSAVDYQHYDPPRNLSALLPQDQVDHVFLNKLSTYRQLRELAREGYDIFVNLCEGYLDWDVPSVDVIHALDQLGLPYTGPSAHLYDPPKDLMKYVAYCAGIPVPAYVRITCPQDVSRALDQLTFPIFVKPAHAGDSLGIDEQSLVTDPPALRHRVDALLDTYGVLLAEQYIAGREFTVLVAAGPGEKEVRAFLPVEYRFPAGRSFKTYALKTSELHPDCNVPCRDPDLAGRLREASCHIFRGFGGVGYARLDFRVDAAGMIYFLEINFTCSVFYPEGFEGSADFILRYDGIGQAGFLRHIIAEGIARHRRNSRPYVMQGSALSGYGIYATRDLAAGEVVFRGEERPHRLVSRRYVEQTWSAEEKDQFRRYAYPVSPEVYVLWDEDPAGWAPQNHHCDPNTAYEGLNVIALRPVRAGEELTLDYGRFLDDSMEPFDCRCGSPRCRGRITGRSSAT